MIDLTNKSSLDQISPCLEQCANANVRSIIIAGNKLDIVEANPSAREVLLSDVADFQKDANFSDDITYLEFSAKNNPELPFSELLSKIQTKQ